jgi:Flp pilus assembly protein TadD
MYDVGAMWARLLLFVSLAFPVLAASAGQAPAGTVAQSAEDHLNQAKRYVSEQKTDLAIAELKQVVALDPGNIEARGNLGVLLYFHGDYAGAVPELRATVQAQPDLWKIRALLGMAEDRTGDPDGARRPRGGISAPCGRESAGRRGRDPGGPLLERRRS